MTWLAAIGKLKGLDLVLKDVRPRDKTSFEGVHCTDVLNAWTILLAAKHS